MKVLVVGDVIIDRYTHGKRKGISAETPTVVAKFDREEMFVGGAGLVVRHLLRLGNEVTLLTTCWMDPIALWQPFLQQTDELTQDERNRLTIETLNLPDWRITEKRRYFVDAYKMVQYDVTNEGKYDHNSSRAFGEKFRQILDRGFHAVVVSDNRHGVLDYDIAFKIVDLCLYKKVHLYVDSQVSQHSSNHSCYHGANHIFLNDREMDAVCDEAQESGFLYDPSKGPAAFCSRFLEANVIHKMGERGAELYQLGGQVVTDPGFKVNAVDTCGAGDAFLAGYVHWGTLEGANRWAALSTTKMGTIVPKLEELEGIKR